MKCSTARQMIRPYLSGDLSDSELSGFLEHIDSCSECYDELEVYYAIYQTLRGEKDDGNYNFIDKLNRKLAESRKNLERRHRYRIFRLAVVGIAEAVCLLSVLLLLDYHGIYIGKYRLLGRHLLFSETEGESENVYPATEGQSENVSAGAKTESSSGLLLTEAESEAISDSTFEAGVAGLSGVTVTVEDTTEASLPAAPVAIELQVEDDTESETEPDGRNMELIAESIGFAQSGNVSAGLARGHVSEEAAVGAARPDRAEKKSAE